jgi:uncharacterized membrane protein
MRKFAWGVMTFLALSIAGYAVLVMVAPQFGPPFVRDRLGTIPLAIYAHLGGAAFALAAGAFQHNSGLRARYLNAHRWSGRVYVISVLVGGIAGLALSFVSEGGATTHFGFGMLAVLWLWSTAQAYLKIRAGDEKAHRRWMTRSYALTYAAVMLRVYLPLSLAARYEFVPAYQVIAWMCWVPNLIVAEWWLLRRDA